MQLKPPRFLEGMAAGEQVDVVAEFLRFRKARPVDSAACLGWFADRIRAGDPAEMPVRERVAAQEPAFCNKQVKGWVLFYEVIMEPFDIVILLIAPLRGADFAVLCATAERRRAGRG